jgi:hypothetical protein
MATTVDLRGGSDNLPATPMKQGFSVKKRVSFVTNPAGATDIRNVMTLKQGQFYAVVVDLLTAEGGAATIDIVTTETSPQTVLDDGSINGTGVLYGDGADGDAAPIWFYVLDDCILNIVANTAATGAAVMDVDVFVMDASIDLS